MTSNEQTQKTKKKIEIEAKSLNCLMVKKFMEEMAHQLLKRENRSNRRFYCTSIILRGLVFTHVI